MAGRFELSANALNKNDSVDRGPAVTHFFRLPAHRRVDTCPVGPYTPAHTDGGDAAADGGLVRP